MSGFIGGVIGFVSGAVAGIVIMCVLIAGKQGDVHSASPIADEGGKDSDSPKEVVRCKDCRHLMFSDCYGECSKGYMGIVSPNDFCSKGERKDGGD